MKNKDKEPIKVLDEESKKFINLVDNYQLKINNSYIELNKVEKEIRNKSNQLAILKKVEKLNYKKVWSKSSIYTRLTLKYRNRTDEVNILAIVLLSLSLFDSKLMGVGVGVLIINMLYLLFMILSVIFNYLIFKNSKLVQRKIVKKLSKIVKLTNKKEELSSYISKLEKEEHIFRMEYKRLKKEKNNEE